MTGLEDFVDKKIIVQTADHVHHGALKEIDDENGAITIKKENKLEIIPFIEIINCELNDTISNDAQDPAIIQIGDCVDNHEKTSFFTDKSSKYTPNFIQMTKTQKKNLIRENYKQFGPSKEVAAYISAIYSVNYLRNKFLREDTSKKICIVINKSDWFSQVTFNISRVLFSIGYEPSLISVVSVDQEIVNHLFYSKKEKQLKKDEIKGEFDLAIIAVDDASIIDLNKFKSKNMVFIGIPKNHQKLQNIFGLFYGPFEAEYFSFNGELVFVQSGLSRKNLIRIGVDSCPHTGYIICPK